MKSTTRTIFIASECATRRRILIAGMGTSPAVLTETVWALLVSRIRNHLY